MGKSTEMTWSLEQLHIHCHVTMTDVCTLVVKYKSHEATSYDSVIVSATLATVNTILNDFFWIPERPINFCGKDGFSLTMNSASAAAGWGYDAAITP